MPIRLANNNQIKVAQEWLTHYGFNPGKIDGIMGSNTRGAVIRAQKWLQDQGLYDGAADGIVGEKTINAMNAVTNKLGTFTDVTDETFGRDKQGNKVYHLDLPQVEGSMVTFTPQQSAAKQSVITRQPTGIAQSAATAGQSAARQSASEKISAQNTVPSSNSSKPSQQGTSSSIPGLKIDAEGYPVRQFKGLFGRREIWRVDPQTNRRSYLKTAPNGTQYWDYWK